MMPSAVHLYIQITFLIFHCESGENKNPPPLNNKPYNTKTIESLNITAQLILIYKNIIEILKLTGSQKGYVRPKPTLHVCMFGWRLWLGSLVTIVQTVLIVCFCIEWYFHKSSMGRIQCWFQIYLLIRDWFKHEVV